MIRDPLTGRISSTRVAGLSCIAVACFVAIWAVLHGVEQAETVKWLAVGAGVALLVRKRAE